MSKDATETKYNVILPKGTILKFAHVNTENEQIRKDCFGGESTDTVSLFDYFYSELTILRDIKATAVHTTYDDRSSDSYILESEDLFEIECYGDADEIIKKLIGKR